jgi:Fe2+ or Zn2+ uptake regulation protein
VTKRKDPPVASEAIQRVLAEADEPLTIEQICEKVWGRCGSREKNTAYVNLHRLDERGLLEKVPMRYQLRRKAGT